MRLLAAFEVAGAEVRVEQVEHAPVRQLDVRPDASPLLTLHRGQVVVLRGNDREAAEDGIAIGVAAMFPVLAKDEVVAADVRCEVEGLVVLGRGLAVTADDFLQGDNVRLEPAQHLRDACRTDPLIEPAALMDVVTYDPQQAGAVSVVIPFGCFRPAAEKPLLTH